MDSRSQLLALLSSLKNVSQRILIVDPENPSNNTLKSRIWHFYYVHFLKDQGQHFLTWEEFQKILREFYGKENTNFKKVSTIKGYYMYCYIENI